MFRSKLTLALAVVLIGLAVWLGRPVARADLGIVATPIAGQRCSAPRLSDIRYEQKTRCPPGNPNGCADRDHVSSQFLPFALASMNAYGHNRRFQLGKLDVEWKLQPQSFTHVNGLGLDVYTRPAGQENHVLVAFRGTDTIGGIVPLPNDAIANMSWVTQFFNPWDQYRMAREQFRSIRTKAFADARGRTVRFFATGHSLGGGIAAHIARGFPCVTAVTFNSSCVSNEHRFSEPYGEAQVIQVRENRDWLSKVICAPGELLGWNDKAQVYEANWVSDRVTDALDELETALEQHSVGRMAVSMTRRVVCCAQRQRKSASPDCACNRSVLSTLEPTRKMLCDGRKRTDRANDPCNFDPLPGPPATQCAKRC